jgi:hypothetical protein
MWLVPRRRRLDLRTRAARRSACARRLRAARRIRLGPVSYGKWLDCLVDCGVGDWTPRDRSRSVAPEHDDRLDGLALQWTALDWKRDGMDGWLEPCPHVVEELIPVAKSARVARCFGSLAYVWMLSWFDRKTESLVGERTFEALSDALVAQILAVPVDEILGGEWPIDADRSRRLEIAAAFTPDVAKYDYFLGAVTVSTGRCRSPTSRASARGSAHAATPRAASAAPRGRGTLEGDLDVRC